MLAAAHRVLRKRRYRVIRSPLVEEVAPDELRARPTSSTRARARGWRPSAGYLREAGNLLFHLSVLVVLVGFALGGLFGYKGGVILVVGNGFSNNLTQYDDFDPGSPVRPGPWSRSASPSTTSTWTG